MRPLLLLGIALIGLGAFVLLRGASFTKRDEVLKVGDVKVTADSRQAVPAWAGVIGIVAGVACIAAGARRRA
jgi:hypothetical protein